ncbi:MAG: N-acetylmuramoyl-L-alanine amidase [Defluviitaleaceae bacterium]|nr:N-acetylmuramoyl-L-alanine amidase [Defluviitaleaceae bacterium]
MKMTQQPSPNNNAGRQGQIPDFIVCHITGGSFTSALNTIANRNNQVSYHFVVSGRGEIVQAVDIADTAWANGTTNSGDNRDNRHSTIPEVRNRRRNANQYTVSIGFADSHNGALTPVQLLAGVDLIWHIRNEVQKLFGHEIPMTRTRIVGHHEITPITRAFCPGPQFPWDEIIRRLGDIEAYENGAYVVNEQDVSHPGTPTPSSWAREAWAWGRKLGLTDGTNPQGTPTREQMVTLLHRYHMAVRKM